MDVNFIYTQKVDSDEPIILIDTHIGYDESEGQGIDGQQFVRELLALDEMGKKSIKVWINSPGGIVMDGYNIYNAILKTKTKVDTYCVGIAASIAAVIFQAGRKRVMNNYSALMYHNPYGSGNGKELTVMKESIAKMISERTGKSVDEILKIMDRTTWINASEALIEGFCDEVEVSSDFNKKHGNTTDAKAMWSECRHVLNSIFSNKTIISKMTKVANKLGLVQDANEDSILEAINAISNKKAEAEDKLKKMEDELEAKKAECDKLEDELKAAKKKAEDADKKAEEEAKNAKKAEAKNFIESVAKVGKIKNDEATIAKWVNAYINDEAGTKDLIDSLTINRVSNKIEIAGSNPATESTLTNQIALKMNELRNQLTNN